LAAARMGEGGALPERLKRLLVYTYGRLAELAAGRGDTEELERIFVSATSRLPEEPSLRQMESAWIQEAAVRLAEEELHVEAAVALLLRHLEGSPVRETLLHTSAVLAVNEANRRSEDGAPHRGEILLGRVLEDLRRARAPVDQLGMVQAGLGNMRFAMEHYPEAAQAWRAALAMGWDPDGTTRSNLFAALLNQAARASNTGDCGTATHFAREALGVIPSDAQALRILTRCGL
jgi:tetratricopeptide (TPR) repeat protein